MREYVFRGWSEYHKKWIYGNLIQDGKYCCILPYQTSSYDPYLDPNNGAIEGYAIPVVPESVGEWTGMEEFVLVDKTCNDDIFEGDIVEVWGWRSVYGRNQSQYDKRVKVRGVIYFNSRGQWYINYDNKYNEVLAELKGQETEKRQAHGAYELYYYGYHGSDIEKYRAKELEWHGRFHNQEDIYGHNDIVKIGTVFENADLLEG